MQLYISLRVADNSFHTIILKKKIKEHTYLAAIGYGGGGVYEEVFAKLKYDITVWEKNNEIVLWKEFIKTLPISIEYNINF